MKGCYKKKGVGKLSTSDQIDKGRHQSLAGAADFRGGDVPGILCVRYHGGYLGDRLGQRWCVLETAGICSALAAARYNEVADEFGEASQVVNGFLEYASENGVDTEAVEAALDTESEEFDPAAAKAALTAFAGQFSATDTATYVVVDEETMADEEVTATGADLQRRSPYMISTVMQSRIRRITAYGFPVSRCWSSGAWTPLAARIGCGA